MTLREVAEYFGLHFNTFYSIKNSNRKRFEYMFGLDKSKILSYRKYIDKQVEVKQRLTYIYYELQDQKRLTDFSSFLRVAGLFTSDLSFLNAVSKIIFSSDSYFTKHETFIKYEKIVELYYSEYKR